MPITVITLQTWTNAKIRRTTVMFTLSVATLLVHLIVLVFKDIQEMASIVMVMLINQCSFEYRMNTKLPIQIRIYSSGPHVVIWRTQFNRIGFNLLLIY